MKVGLCLPQLGGHVTRKGLQGFAEQAEELGFGGLWVQEHLFYPHQPVSGYSARPGLAVPEAYRSVLSPLETLAAVAAWTSDVEIGTRSSSPGCTGRSTWPSGCPRSTCSRRDGSWPASAWAGPTRSTS